MGKRPHEDCEDCPNYESESHCKVMLSEVALDLINRQQAVIEKQRENNKAMMQTIADVHTEAIKEFAERLEANFEISSAYSFGYIACQIDNLVKEMVGDAE